MMLMHDAEMYDVPAAACGDDGLLHTAVGSTMQLVHPIMQINQVCMST